jgi:hypothetical protein
MIRAKLALAIEGVARFVEGLGLGGAGGSRAPCRRCRFLGLAHIVGLGVSLVPASQPLTDDGVLRLDALAELGQAFLTRLGLGGSLLQAARDRAAAGGGVEARLSAQRGQLRLQARDTRLRLGHIKLGLLRGRARPDAAAHPPDGGGRAGRGARNGLGQPERLVELSDEFHHGLAQHAKGAAHSGGQFVELLVDVFAGAQQCLEHAIRGELPLAAHRPQLANADAKLLRQCLGQGGHVLQDGAKLVTLQCARRQRLPQLLPAGGGLLGGGT